MTRYSAARSSVQRLSAIICFGLPEQQVDILMEGLTGTSSEPTKWIVFGSDAALMAALNDQWVAATDLIAVITPKSLEGLEEAALAILQSERMALAESVWVLGPAVAWLGPDNALAVIHSATVGIAKLVAEFGSLTGGG